MSAPTYTRTQNLQNCVANLPRELFSLALAWLALITNTSNFRQCRLLTRDHRPYLVAMRAVIQRVKRASVEVEEKIVSQIGQGLLVFLGIESTDAREDITWLAAKIARLRIFPDESGAMNRSVQDISGDLLVVSQFTLLASTRKGNRPSFISAAAPEVAIQRYEEFCHQLEMESARPVRRGVFGAHMKIDLVNDGPVTICIDTKRKE